MVAYWGQIIYRLVGYSICGSMEEIKKKCIECNIEFIPKNNQQLYCSRKCQRKHSHRKQGWYKEPYTKICPNCNNEFITKRSDKVYCSSRCYLAHQRQIHHDKIRANARNYYKKNSERIKASQKQRRKINKLHYDDLRLKNTYGISLSERNDILAKQDWKCAICGTSLLGRKINIDHDHNTGKVRGILCNGCNRGLGFFDDNIENLKNAIKYLENHTA